MPTLRRSEAMQVRVLQSISLEPRQPGLQYHLMNLSDAPRRLFVGEFVTSLLAFLKKILLPKRTAAQDPARAGFQGHADLFLVIREIDASAKQHPWPFRS